MTEEQEIVNQVRSSLLKHLYRSDGIKMEGSRIKIHGFSLVELLVSLTIGMLIVLVICYTYLASNNILRTIEINSRLQENARMAFELISYDVRMAGVSGCHLNSYTNVLTDKNAYDKNLFEQPLVGYENGLSTFPSDLSSRLRGDALTILRSSDSEYIIGSHNPSSAQFDLLNNKEHDIKPGEILIAADCVNHYAAIFQMTGPANNNNNAKNIVHNTGSDSLNCTKYLGAPSDSSNCETGTAYEFPAGSKLLRLNGNTYYVRMNGYGEPTLYRQRLSHSEEASASLADELIEGVQDINILYGVDTSATADNAVDQYVAASQVTSVAPGATDSDKWRRVMSVRISLLMVSTNDESATLKPQAYVFDGVSYDGGSASGHGPLPNDKKLRKVFTTTIAIRNRL